MDRSPTLANISGLISDLQSPNEIMASYRTALINNPVLYRLDKALACGVFKDDVGNVERLGDVSVSVFQVAVINFLVRALKPAVTAETGFGIGVSAIAFLGSTGQYSHQKHLCIDPYGLPGRGATTLNYIQQMAGERFELIKEPSEYALPRLISTGELSNCSLSLIDGAHLFDVVMADITYLDRVTPMGGCIILDDAGFPAIETAVNYVESNKENYHVVRLKKNFADTVVLVKTAPSDGRDWYHFRPFPVPKRKDWNSKESRSPFKLLKVWVNICRNQGRRLLRRL
jgi:hypothetical protein